MWKKLRILFAGEKAKKVGGYVLKLVAREGRRAFEKRYGELTMQTLVSLVARRGAGLDGVWDEAFAAIKAQVLADGVRYTDTWIAQLMVGYYESIKAQDSELVGGKVEV